MSLDHVYKSSEHTCLAHMYMFSMRKSMHVLNGVVVLTGAILFQSVLLLGCRLTVIACHAWLWVEIDWTAL